MEPVFVAFGSNLGASERTLLLAAQRLSAVDGLVEVARSSMYRTVPVGGPSGQPDYINMVVEYVTRLEPNRLLDVLQHVEREFHRVRVQRWGPRTLDLDIIFFGNRVLNTCRLQIPHPRLYERGFVLAPLVEIAPTWKDPVSGLTVRQLYHRWARQVKRPQDFIHRLTTFCPFESVYGGITTARTASQW